MIENELKAEINRLDAQIKAEHERLDVQLRPLFEQRGKCITRLNMLYVVKLEQETGLNVGDDLVLTPEFLEFDRKRGNQSHLWKVYSGQLRVGADSPKSYNRNRTIRIEKGGASTGEVPYDLVQRMRAEWLRKFG